MYMHTHIYTGTYVNTRYELLALVKGGTGRWKAENTLPPSSPQLALKHLLQPPDMLGQVSIC